MMELGINQLVYVQGQAEQSLYSVGHIIIGAPRVSLNSVFNDSSYYHDKEKVRPFWIQVGDEVTIKDKVGSYTAVGKCIIEKIYYDHRGNLKLESKNFEFITGYKSMYYEQFTELFTGFTE